MATMVFVYGTLRQGGRLHRYMQGAGTEYVGVGTAQGWAMYDVGYFPAVEPVAGSACDAIAHGEVYEVDAEALRALDRVEGVPHLYRRGTTLVTLQGGERVLAAIYFMQPGAARAMAESYQRPRVHHGDWMLHIAEGADPEPTDDSEFDADNDGEVWS